MDEKVVTSLISVVVGWFLAQGTTIAKNFWAGRNFKSGLLTELKDIQDQMQRVVLIHGRKLQISALKGMESSIALPIQNLYFKQYFKEAFSHLNREQRISYQLIHSHLESLNRMNEELGKFTEEASRERHQSPADHKTLYKLEAWGDRIVCIYKAARTIQWHIAYHLENPNSPAFDIMGSMHESYTKFKQDLDCEVKDILEKAKNLKREDFEKIYDPEGFRRSLKMV